MLEPENGPVITRCVLHAVPRLNRCVNGDNKLDKDRDPWIFRIFLCKNKVLLVYYKGSIIFAVCFFSSQGNYTPKYNGGMENKELKMELSLRTICCPKCGSESYESTCVGYPVGKDENSARCTSCDNSGKMWEWQYALALRILEKNKLPIAYAQGRTVRPPIKTMENGIVTNIAPGDESSLMFIILGPADSVSLVHRIVNTMIEIIPEKKKERQ